MIESDNQNINLVVTSQWLNDHLSDNDIVILEVYQEKNKAGLVSNIRGSIPNSIFVDIKSLFSDPSGQFPNTFPTVEQFNTSCNKLGVRNDSRIVIVDRLGTYTGPRLWFLFKAMGHKSVAVLDGGLPTWVDEGYEVVPEKKLPSSTDNYNAQLDTKLVKSIDDIQENIKSSNSIIIDARSSDRFLSRVSEPHPEIRSGNIPNSINIPFKSLLDGHKFKSNKELKSVFAKHDLSDKSLIFSCGSGVTACIVMLASEFVNDSEKSIYDGSWTEWATLMK